MSQYLVGTASVTNGSATVTGTNTLWLANVTAGYSFTVAGDGVMYDVASVDSDTQVTLSAPYAGVTAGGAVYAIGTGFTVPDSFPEMSQGDIETATIFTRAMRKIQSKFSGIAINTTAEIGQAVSDHEATNDHPLATTIAKGFLSAVDKTKLDTVESGATADQTDAEIKIAYESNADTNEFSDAEKTKLLGIEDGATADQTKADIDALNIDADTLDGINSLGFDAAGAADTAVSDHVALADPHAQYAGLDGGASANFTTMPQVGGDPIVESGSNADGEWTRWADGTQITHLISGTLTASDEVTSGSGLYSSGTSAATFPRAFDVIPLSALGARGTSGAGLSGTVGWASAREANGASNTTTAVEVGFTSPEQNATALVWVVSVGRWQ